MIHVSRAPEFSNCGGMNSVLVCTPVEQEMSFFSGSRGRQRSHSYYSPEDCKNYGVPLLKEETSSRPRSRYDDANTFLYHVFCYSDIGPSVFIKVLNKLLQRSFYSFETSELHFDNETDALIQNTTAPQPIKANKKEKKDADGDAARPTSKKTPSNKILLSRELNGKLLPWPSVCLPNEFLFYCYHEIKCAAPRDFANLLQGAEAASSQWP